jgi:hypothetical protein
MNSSNWMDDLKARIAADPKRSGALGVLAVVLCLMVGRLMLQDKRKPASASAAPVPTASSSKKAKLAAKSITAPQRSPGAMGAMQRWAEESVPPVSRNLFNVRMEYFPSDSSRTGDSDATDEGFWAKLEKSMALQTDQKDRQENLRANFQSEAGKLRLQSIVMGSSPRAMINGELVGEGNVVANFRVLKIEARRIIVEREGILLEIQMK